MAFFLLYFVIVSVLSIFITVYDKKISKKSGKRRISEKALLILAVLGGSFAEYLTMLKIRHKTKHKKFMIGLPVLIILQLTLGIYLVFSYGA